MYMCGWGHTGFRSRCIQVCTGMLRYIGAPRGSVGDLGMLSYGILMRWHVGVYEYVISARACM